MLRLYGWVLSGVFDLSFGLGVEGVAAAEDTWAGCNAWFVFAFRVALG